MPIDDLRKQVSDFKVEAKNMAIAISAATAMNFEQRKKCFIL